MFYDRKIKYVNVYENGEKGQSAGFIKMEARNSTVSLQIQVAGLHHTDTCSCPIVLLSGEKEFVIGELQLERGKGVKEFVGLDLADMGGQIGYTELEEIQIRPAGSRLLRCMIQERVRETKAPVVEEPMAEEIGTEMSEAVAGEINSEMTEAVTGEMNTEMSEVVTEEVNTEIPRAVKAEMVEEKNVKEAARNVEVAGKSEAELLKEAFMAEKRLREGEDANVTEEEQNQSVQKTMQPPNVRTPQPVDKWQQLLAIYPHIRPFEDRREYLMMKPQDFVILPQKYFALADNSFLLHGYYNYDHLILSKEKRPEGEQMYIGVPGNFYDKEKQVAVMFGFESFEGKREPARTGDFGYYMIPVEI